MRIRATEKYQAIKAWNTGLTFLTRLIGPGKVIIQSQNFMDFAGRITSMIPGGR